MNNGAAAIKSASTVDQNVFPGTGDRQEARAKVAHILDAAGAHDVRGLLVEEGKKLALGGGSAEARVLLERRLEIKPDDTTALCILAFAEMAEEDYSSAHGHLLKALELMPDDKGVLVNLFTTCYLIGLTADAAKYSEQAVKLYPDCAEAHFFYSRTVKYAEGHWHIPVLEKAYHSFPAGSRARKLAGFAMYEAMNAVGRYDDAFAALDDANGIRRKELPYSREREERRAMALMATFSPDRARQFFKGGYAGSKPIFIVGMPRSGSTLTEQILASHRDVHGGGETNVAETVIFHNFLNTSGDIALPDVSKMTPEALRAAGKLLADELARRSGDKTRYVDKNLFNFLWVGHIMAMMPDAKFIHMRRSPLATCLANYSSSFENEDIRFLYDLEDIAAYYVMQERMMAWWKVLFPQSILDLSYEELTLDQRGKTEELLQFCEMDWDDNCLTFHKTERTVNTSSAGQVRQSMYSGVDRKTMNYERQLEPAARILREAGLLQV